MTDPRKAHQDLMTSEALSRRDEAVANIHRSHGIQSEFTERAAQADKEEAERERLANAASAKDYEGTVTDRADAAGNVADDAKQANEGGIGVAASNSGPSEQGARVQSQPDPSKEPEKGDESGKLTKEQEAREAEIAKVNIPDNWKSKSWPDRQNLAKSLARGGEKVNNGDDADKIIAAEVERRAKA